VCCGGGGWGYKGVRVDRRGCHCVGVVGGGGGGGLSHLSDLYTYNSARVGLGSIFC